MCRLYAMHANEPTRVECGLVRSQNALMAQSKSDREGVMHGHGWGVADYNNGLPAIERQTWAAFHGEHFSQKASKVYAKTVVAHVRRATVGPISIENTHPFHYGRWIFAHNGTVPHFDEIRHAFLESMDPIHRNGVEGETDSEHIFRYLMSLFLRHPEHGLLEIVQRGLSQIIAWVDAIDPDARPGLNIVLTDGEQMVGSRYNRSLVHLFRDHAFECPICKKPHVHDEPKRSYRAVEFASEPVTQFDVWDEIPNKKVYRVNEDFSLDLRDLP